MRGNKAALMLVTALTSLTLVVSGCGGGNTPESSTAPASSASSSAAASPADPFGKYDPPITVKAVRSLTEDVKFISGEDIENNAWPRLYKEMGIDLKYDWIVKGTDQYNQKLSVSIASNVLPDIMMVSATQLKQMVDGDQLADLTDAYNDYASPEIKKLMTEDENAIKSATFDGKLMAIPSVQPAIGSSVNLLWVRADWLKKLNLAEPKTMEDVQKIAEAFTKNDPDGNGKPDSFGIGLNKDITNSLNGFFNGYHAYVGTWIKDDSGKLVYGSVQPQIKQALAKLQEMYKAGQMDKEFGVKDNVKEFESVAAGKIGLLYGPSWYPYWPFNDVVKANPEADWKAFPIPSIDSTPASAQMPFSVSSYYVVKKGFKNPEVIVKMANLFHEKQYGKTAEFGTYGESTQGVSPYKYSFVYLVSPNKDTDRQKAIAEALETKDPSKLNPEAKDLYEKIVAYRGGDKSKWPDARQNDPEGSHAMLSAMMEQNRIKSDEFVGAPTETMSETKVTLDKLETETFTKIIYGNASVDEFDKFVSDWKKLGGDQITQEVNEWNASK